MHSEAQDGRGSEKMPRDSNERAEQATGGTERRLSQQDITCKKASQEASSEFSNRNAVDNPSHDYQMKPNPRFEK